MAGYAFIAVDGGTTLAESPSPAENLRLKIPERGQDTTLKALPRFRIASQGRVEWAGRQLIGVKSEVSTRRMLCSMAPLPDVKTDCLS